MRGLMQTMCHWEVGGLGDDGDADEMGSDQDSNIPSDLRVPKPAKKPAASNKVTKKPSAKRTKKRGDQEEYFHLPATYRN